MISVRALPSPDRRESTTNAAKMKPIALVTKIKETTAYPRPVVFSAELEDFDFDGIRNGMVRSGNDLLGDDRSRICVSNVFGGLDVNESSESVGSHAEIPMTATSGAGATPLSDTNQHGRVESGVLCPAGEHRASPWIMLGFNRGQLW